MPMADADMVGAVGKMSKISTKCPKLVQNCPKISEKRWSYLQNQNVWDLLSKSYCWSLNLLGAGCPGAATICSSDFRALNSSNLKDSKPLKSWLYGFKALKSSRSLKSSNLATRTTKSRLHRDR